MDDAGLMSKAKARDLGLEPLAELLGVSQQAVNKMKRRGFCSPQRAEQIANNFAIPAEELVDPALVKLLQEHVKASIAPYKYPRAIAFVPALPKTATGKLQRFALRRLAQGES